VQALLDLGADPYCADVSGTSPLMMAAAGGHEAAVKVSGW
jgi:ankyrin repeat protein